MKPKFLFSTNPNSRRTDTLSEYPLLIGEILRRANQPAPRVLRIISANGKPCADILSRRRL